MTVSKSWVAEKLREHAYDIACLRERFKRHQPADMHCNETWGLDMTGKRDELGQTHAVVGLIDHGSRRALVLEPACDRTATGLLKFVVAAVERFGKPKTLRTDNESVFKSKIFTEGLKLLNIRQKFSRLGQPWDNGYIERLFGTLKESLNQLVVPNAAALAQALAVFKAWYNEVRPHNHLHGLTPHEAWHDIDPYRNAPRHVEHFEAWDGLLTGLRIRY